MVELGRARPNPQDDGWAGFFCKRAREQIVSVGSVSVTQLCHWIERAPVDMEMIGCGINKFYLQTLKFDSHIIFTCHRISFF